MFKVVRLVSRLSDNYFSMTPKNFQFPAQPHYKNPITEVAFCGSYWYFTCKDGQSSLPPLTGLPFQKINIPTELKSLVI